jgi:hypothetical protein
MAAIVWLERRPSRLQCRNSTPGIGGFIMSLRTTALAIVACHLLCVPARAANSASGSVTADKLGTITVSHAAAYLVRDGHATRTEIMLTDVAVNAAGLQNEFNPHMAAINLDALKDRNYVLLWINADGSVSMNATFSKTMTQILDATSGRLKVTWTTNSPARADGRLFSGGPLKTMDGSSFTVDLKFGVDVPAAPAGTPLAAGGGDPGKALTAFIAAAQKKSWTAIKSVSSPDALKTFDKSYNTPAENASDVLDLLKAWLPLEKMKITGGQLRGDVAILDVEGQMFPGQASMIGVSIVRMVKSGTVWQFDKATRVGMVK